MSKQSFVHGAMILLASSLITNMLHMSYRAMMARVIGPEGMGLFQMVSPVLYLATTLVRAGLPSAISKLVAESLAVGNYRRVRRVLFVTSGTILTLAVGFTVLLYALSPWITHHVLSDPRAYYALISTIPLVFIIALSSILAGYFQGTQNMGPSGTANILEMVVRIGSVWLLARYFMHFGLGLAAAAAGIGMVAGESVSFIYLLLRYFSRSTTAERRAIRLDQRPIEPISKTLGSIGEIAVPVTISSIVGSIGYWLETFLIPRCIMWAGFSQVAATTMFGQFSSMAVPLLFFPSVFTGALTTTLIPAIAEAVAAHKMVLVGRRLYQSFRVTALIGFPASIILTLFAAPLSQMMYNDASVGPMLAAMAPFGFLLYFGDPLIGILQGLNRARILMIHSVIGNIVSLGLIYLLAKQPSFNIMGVVIALIVSQSLTTVLNFIAVHRLVGFSLYVTETLKILCSAIGMMGVLMRLRHVDYGFGLTWNTIVSLVIGLSVYSLSLIMTRVVTTVEVRRIPKVGRVLARIVSFVPYAR